MKFSNIICQSLFNTAHKYSFFLYRIKYTVVKLANQPNICTSTEWINNHLNVMVFLWAQNKAMQRVFVSFIKTFILKKIWIIF